MVKEMRKCAGGNTIGVAMLLCGEEISVSVNHGFNQPIGKMLV